MSNEISRREMLHRTVKGTVLVGIGGTAAYLVRKAHGELVWQVNASRCVNSRLDQVDAEVCTLCTTQCVVAHSAVRAVNDFSKCGRCYICPAYFDINSAVDEQGLPSQKLCPRDAIERIPIGKIDPEDPANNFYDYIIDEEKCDGCGRCVLKCKEPLGLGSITLKVRYNKCVDCNRCTIALDCPKDAISQVPKEEGLQITLARHEE